MRRVGAGMGLSALETLDARSQAITLLLRRLTVKTCLCNAPSACVGHFRSRHVDLSSKDKIFTGPGYGTSTGTVSALVPVRVTWGFSKCRTAFAGDGEDVP